MKIPLSGFIEQSMRDEAVLIDPNHSLDVVRMSGQAPWGRKNLLAGLTYYAATSPAISFSLWRWEPLRKEVR